MTSILAYAAELPTLRLPASAYVAAWGSCAASGLKRKTVCAYDEDPVTLAIAAARRALAAAGDPDIAAVYVGATTLPYEEKPSSATILTGLTGAPAAVYELRGSPQAGLQALRLAAMEAERLPEGQVVLAIATDAPAAAPDTLLEHALGAGAAAFVIGSGPGIATLGPSMTISHESFGARFRRAGSPLLQDLELRTQDDRKAADLLASRFDLTADHLATGLSPRAAKRLETAAGAESDRLWPILGDAGAASAPLALTDRLDQAQAGATITAVALGAGAAALKLTVDHPRPTSRPVAAQAESGQEIDYVAYLKHRRMLSSRFGDTL